LFTCRNIFIFTYCTYCYSINIVVIMRLLCIQIYTFWRNVRMKILCRHIIRFKKLKKIQIYDILILSSFIPTTKYSKKPKNIYFAQWFLRTNQCTPRIFYSAYDNNAKCRLPMSAKMYIVLNHINAFTRFVVLLCQAVQ